jgi:phosphoglycerol transferase MdoB-like AlkP superfamily enzyme
VVHQFSDSALAGPRPNVVVVILESFSAAYSAKLTGGREGTMPFLDSLMGEGLSFEHAYANGRRSIDGIPAILAAMPELMNEAFIASPYAQQPFTSLPGLLKSEGYRTSFFHGGHNGTMGFDVFARIAGIDRYVGFDEYPDKSHDDGIWGILDRPFLQFFTGELDKEQQPFLSVMFTLTSHHPYKLPEEEAKRFAGDGKSRKIEPTLRYTDDALRQFFATSSHMPWYKNTLFVITADHTADLKRDGQVIREAQDYWVPLVFYMPGRLQPATDDRVVQHIDILPTVLHVIGYSKPFFSFGHSTLAAERPPIAVSSSNGIYMAIGDGPRQLKFDGEKKLPPPITMTQVPDTRDMEPYLKAAIQQFNGRLLSGDLVVTPAP